MIVRCRSATLAANQLPDTGRTSFNESVYTIVIELTAAGLPIHLVKGMPSRALYAGSVSSIWSVVLQLLLARGGAVLF